MEIVRGLQHDLLPVEEEPEIDGVPHVPPSTPETTLSPQPLFRHNSSPDRRRTVSVSDTPAAGAPPHAVQFAVPSSDRLSSARQSSLTVTIALLNAPENMREAHQLRNTTTITAMTGARHLKELQHLRKISQTDIFLNSMFHRRSSESDDRRTHHSAGSHGSVDGPNATHQTTETDLRAQNTARGKSSSVDPSAHPAHTRLHWGSFFTHGSGHSAHKDELPEPSHAQADTSHGMGHRSNSSTSPPQQVGQFQRSLSQGHSSNRRTSEPVEMKELPKK